MKAGDYSSAAYGVNRAGQVVGYTQNQSLPDSAFIYNALNDITTDLNTITLNGGQTAASLNWNLTSAVSINDAGVIVSQGQIISGTYTECCGIGGGLTHPLPDASQGFVELIIDPQRNLAQMTFLGQDMHILAGRYQCLNRISLLSATLSVMRRIRCGSTAELSRLARVVRISSLDSSIRIWWPF